MFKKLTLSIGMLLLCSATIMAAVVPDSLGYLGQILYDILEKESAIGPTGAALIIAIIGFLIRSSGNYLLKKVPIKWGSEGISVIWKILAFLFGKGIIFENAKINDKASPADVLAAKTRMMESIKKDLKKRYPLTNIEVGSFK